MKTHHSKDAKHQGHEDNIENIQRKNRQIIHKRIVKLAADFSTATKRPDYSEIKSMKCLEKQSTQNFTYGKNVRSEIKTF